MVEEREGACGRVGMGNSFSGGDAAGATAALGALGISSGAAGT